MEINYYRLARETFESNLIPEKPITPEAERRRWRRRRDLNPRDPFGSNGFQDRRFQPLTHSSVCNSNVLRE
jgi:hypothetical protein